MNFKKKIKKVIKKCDSKWLVTTIIAIIAICFTLTNQSSIMNIFGTTKIDFSKMIPYTHSGVDINYKEVFLENLSIINYNENNYNKACTIRTYFENSMASVYRISDIYINIKEISPIIESEIDLSATIIDDCIYVYAINQSLEDARNVKVTLNLGAVEYTNIPDIDINSYFNFNQGSSSIMIDRIEGGKIIELFSFNAKREFMDILMQNVWFYFNAVLSIEDNSKEISLGMIYYNEYDQTIELSKSEGDDGIASTFFSFISVSDGEGEYPIQMKNNPNIENAYNVGVDTIIIPDQSCDMIFTIKYKVHNKTIETEEFSARIIVPLYDDSDFYNSLLDYCIDNQILEYKRGTSYFIENNFKYDIYSILDLFYEN